MGAIIKVFPTKQELIKTLCNETAEKLGTAIKSQGHASYVAAGGTTVPDLLTCLSHKDIGWDRIAVTMSDERWTSPENQNSNENLIRRTLLQNKARNARLFPLWSDCETPKKAAQLAHKELRAISLPFDVTLLGMGADQHAASLFPQAPGVKDALDVSQDNLVSAIGPVSGAAGAETRLSLSLKAILSSQVIYIMIVGQKKWDALNEALQETDSYKSPVSAILNQDQCPVFAYWAPE